MNILKRRKVVDVLYTKNKKPIFIKSAQHKSNKTRVQQI